jgi:hypothetical protein
MTSIPKKPTLRRSKSAPNLTANNIMTLKPPTTTTALRERLARLDAGGGVVGGSTVNLSTLQPGMTKEEFRELAREGAFGTPKEAMKLKREIFGPRGYRHGGSRRRRRHKRKTKRKTKRRRRRKRRTHRRRRKRKTRRR